MADIFAVSSAILILAINDSGSASFSRRLRRICKKDRGRMPMRDEGKSGWLIVDLCEIRNSYIPPSPQG